MKNNNSLAWVSGGGWMVVISFPSGMMTWVGGVLDEVNKSKQEQ